MYPEFQSEMDHVKKFLHAFENALGLAISLGNEKSAAEFRLHNAEVLNKKAEKAQQELTERERVMTNQRIEIENRTHDARATLAGVEAQLEAARAEWTARKNEHDRLEVAVGSYRALIASWDK